MVFWASADIFTIFRQFLLGKTYIFLKVQGVSHQNHLSIEVYTLMCALQTFYTQMSAKYASHFGLCRSEIEEKNLFIRTLLIRESVAAKPEKIKQLKSGIC